jgi:hypothetical protein
MPRGGDTEGYFEKIVESTSGFRQTLTANRIGASGPISSFKSLYPTAYPGPILDPGR